MLTTCSSSCHLPLDISWWRHQIRILFFFSVSFLKNSNKTSTNFQISISIFFDISAKCLHQATLLQFKCQSPHDIFYKWSTWVKWWNAHSLGPPMDVCKSPKSLNVPQWPPYFVKYRSNWNLLPGTATCAFFWDEIKNCIFKHTHISFHSNPQDLTSPTRSFSPRRAREALRKSATSCLGAAPTITWDVWRRTGQDWIWSTSRS